MKTFFIAFVLGIFVGALCATYWKEPKAFEGLLGNKPDTPAPHKEAPAEEEKGALDNLAEKTKETFDELKEKAPEFAANAKEKSGALIEATRDGTIATAIRSLYILKKEIDSSPILIDVSDGRVILSGQVASGEMKELAIEVAMSVPGVQEVESKLAIEAENS